MIRFLGDKIPSLLFEPIAFCAVCGILLSFWMYRKKHERFYWVIVVCIFFMFFWRLLCHPVMLSARYASILLYPAVIFTAWFCFHLQKIVYKFIAKKLWLNTFWKKNCIAMLPVLVIVTLFIACLFKTLRYNPYGDHLVKLCRVLSKEIKGKNYMLFIQYELDRVAYYTGVNQSELHCFGVDTTPLTKELLKKHIMNCRNFFDPSYLIFYWKDGEPEPNAELLDLAPGEWVCLYQHYTSRRKNKKIMLYRFANQEHPNIETWEKAIPTMSPKNLYLNGDCESFLTGKDLEDRIAYYKKVKASDFYLTPGRLFPAGGWWFAVGEVKHGKSPEMSLTAVNPISGEYSIEAKSGAIGAVDDRALFLIDWVMNSGSIEKQDCTFSGFIRAESDAEVRAYSCYWDTDQQDTVRMNAFFFRLYAGKTYRFFFPVCVSDVPEEDKRIYIVLQGRGHVLLDNIEFIPTEKDKLEIKK